MSTDPRVIAQNAAGRVTDEQRRTATHDRARVGVSGTVAVLGALGGAAAYAAQPAVAPWVWAGGAVVAGVSAVATAGRWVMHRRRQRYLADSIVVAALGQIAIGTDGRLRWYVDGSSVDPFSADTSMPGSYRVWVLRRRHGPWSPGTVLSGELIPTDETPWHPVEVASVLPEPDVPDLRKPAVSGARTRRRVGIALRVTATLLASVEVGWLVLWLTNRPLLHHLEDILGLEDMAYHELLFMGVFVIPGLFVMASDELATYRRQMEELAGDEPLLLGTYQLHRREQSRVDEPRTRWGFVRSPHSVPGERRPRPILDVPPDLLPVLRTASWYDVVHDDTGRVLEVASAHPPSPGSSPWFDARIWTANGNGHLTDEQVRWLGRRRSPPDPTIRTATAEVTWRYPEYRITSGGRTVDLPWHGPPPPPPGHYRIYYLDRRRPVLLSAKPR